MDIDTYYVHFISHKYQIYLCSMIKVCITFKAAIDRKYLQVCPLLNCIPPNVDGIQGDQIGRFFLIGLLLEALKVAPKMQHLAFYLLSQIFT
jgi:hypothetical protein